MPTVLISGGTGLIGKALTRFLNAKGYTTIILSRHPPSISKSTGRMAQTPSQVQWAAWDIKEETIDSHAIQKADFIIHLSGANLAEKRWSRERKIEICESRIKSSELIVKALKEIPNSVKAVVSASGIGWYGADPEIPNPGPFTETDPADAGFLGKTCQAWEESIGPVRGLGKRLVILRTGLVLSNEGGALKKFEKPIKFGIAAILGSGKQMISWIHIDDICRLYQEAMENENWQGPYNAVAPHPVNNKTLVTELGKLVKGKFVISFYIPSFILKIVFGELSIEVLKSTTVSSKKIRQTGFQFIYPGIEPALQMLHKESLERIS
jgi:uncharacterized protein